MDTKLKNRHKLAIVLMILTILIPVFLIINAYSVSYHGTMEKQKWAQKESFTSESFLKEFVTASYILYGMEYREGISSTEAKTRIREYFPEWMNNFDRLYPYLEYVIEDEDGNVITQNTPSLQSSLKSAQAKERYSLLIEISYDDKGIAQANVRKGELREKQNVEFRDILNKIEEDAIEAGGVDFEGNYGLYTPENRTFIYGVTESNLTAYTDNWYYSGYVGGDEVIQVAIILVILVAFVALLLPKVQSLYTGEEKIFRVSVELPAVVVFVVFMSVFHNIGYMVVRNEGRANAEDVLLWLLVFASTYWLSACLRSMFTLGFERYFKERSLIVKSWGKIKGMCRLLWKKGKDFCDRVYHSFEKIDFEDTRHRFILKIVLWNFVILVVICTMWVYGIMALMIYSVLLFLILRKYFNDLREKYKILLKATNEIAEGNLDVEITEDLGVFRPFKTEIEKIQKGFKNAVQKEVKSQRMKTELITNVSHDLKTPLTAIITYVDLMKNEPDEEKRREYLDILERKSLRLKVLIEDLFEISKANSENVTLELVDVDVVHLFKQVKLEMEDKIAGANLDFRCNYSEEKMTARLDSQKTYRIFENLLVNIVKYAMPHTRVYVEIVKEDGHVVVRMKNISAQELNFNSDEITERFVRGDAARNTEGSGLGLAIVKSFVELQKGMFSVDTEADLFKVEIKF